jgi:biotin carboxylase
VTDSRRLLLITEPNSYRIAAYLAAATQMGMGVLIASRGHYSLISEVHDGLHVDLQDQDLSLKTILQQARVTPFAGVIGIDDSTVELAAKAAREFGLPHNPPAAAQLTRRKDLARAQLVDSGCLTPLHWLINLDRPLQQQMEGITFPCVVKPLMLSASRGVIRSNDKAELIEACNRIEPMLADERDFYQKRHLLVESYIDGVEVAYEGFLRHGELTTLVIFDKPDPLTGPYFEETIYVTPSALSPGLQSTVREQVAMACKAYGLTTGPVHAELRINESGAWILEVAARTIGGECARSLDNVDDKGKEFNLEELVISLAVGQDYELSPPGEARGVMMIPVRKRGVLRRVEGLSDANRVEHIEEIKIFIRTGNTLVPLPEGNQYPGFIFARADTPDDVVAALREAHGKLEFVIAPIINTRLGQ